MRPPSDVHTPEAAEVYTEATSEIQRLRARLALVEAVALLWAGCRARRQASPSPRATSSGHRMRRGPSSTCWARRGRCTALGAARTRSQGKYVHRVGRPLTKATPNSPSTTHPGKKVS